MIPDTWHEVNRAAFRHLPRDVYGFDINRIEVPWVMTMWLRYQVWKAVSEYKAANDE